MRSNQVLGLIFSNAHDDVLRDFTAIRALGSVPFGGRYRLIDFTLSNMVHAGIDKVGVITKRNSQSLMDHIGSGKSWGLSRKTDGLYFLTPYDVPDNLYDGRVAALHSLDNFLEGSLEEYVVMADCHVIHSMVYDELIRTHVESGADITVGYRRGECPRLADNMVLTVDPKGRVEAIRLGICPQGEHCCGLGVYVIGRQLLRELVAEAASGNQMNFDRDILQQGLSSLHIHGFEMPADAMIITSPETYFDANMSLLRDDVRARLFPARMPVYTKVRDCCPAVYGLHSEVSGSLVADGSRVDGTVRNSILFRDVQVEEGAVVENSIVMQGTIIRSGAAVGHVILDKDVEMREGRILRGFESYPIYVGKGRKI